MAKVIGFELSSQEPEKAAKFYSDVFGWKITEQMWDYWSIAMDNLHNSEGLIGGISKGPADYPHGTRIQLLVESIEDTMKKATENGAMIVRGKMEFEDFYLAYLVDPTGIGFGLIERKEKW